VAEREKPAAAAEGEGAAVDQLWKKVVVLVTAPGESSEIEAAVEREAGEVAAAETRKSPHPLAAAALDWSVAVSAAAEEEVAAAAAAHLVALTILDPRMAAKAAPAVPAQ